MIAGEKAFVVSLRKNTAPSSPEKELIYDAGIIMSDFPIAGSPLEKILQKYTGTYLNIAEWESKRQSPAKLEEVISDIQKIRNTLWEMDPKNVWFYYDNAGTYIHLLQDTYNKLTKRLNEYNKTPFIIIGDDMTDFLGNFWLEKYVLWYFKNYDDLDSLVEKISRLQKKQPVRIIFSEIPPSKEIISIFKKKLNITIYTLASVDEDTSNWWYLRFIEKRINTFVEAYDTYD